MSGVGIQRLVPCLVAAMVLGVGEVGLLEAPVAAAEGRGSVFLVLVCALAGLGIAWSAYRLRYETRHVRFCFGALLFAFSILLLSSRPGAVESVVLGLLVLAGDARLTLMLGVYALVLGLWALSPPLKADKGQVVRPSAAPTPAADADVGKRTGHSGILVTLITVGVIITILLVAVNDLPIRLRFELGRDDLLKFARSAQGSRSTEDDSLWVGSYRLLGWGPDDRGGVFLCVQQGRDAIDMWSYGFAYRPNDQGTPFGDADYRKWPLGNDWYEFSANTHY